MRGLNVKETGLVCGGQGAPGQTDWDRSEIEYQFELLKWLLEQQNSSQQ